MSGIWELRVGVSVTKRMFSVSIITIVKGVLMDGAVEGKVFPIRLGHLTSHMSCHQMDLSIDVSIRLLLFVGKTVPIN